MNDSILKQELAQRNFELLNSSNTENDGVIELNANKLHEINDIDNEIVYVPINVTMDVHVDNNDHIISISGGEPSESEISNSENLINLLIANKQLADLSNLQTANATHKIEINTFGQKVIRRNRIFAY